MRNNSTPAKNNIFDPGLSSIFEQLFMVFMVVFSHFHGFHGYFFPQIHGFHGFLDTIYGVFSPISQIELWRRQIFIENFIFCTQNLLTILLAASENFRSFCPPQAKILGKFWPEISVFMVLLDKFRFSWFFHGFHGWAPFSWFSWLSESPGYKSNSLVFNSSKIVNYVLSNNIDIYSISQITLLKVNLKRFIMNKQSATILLYTGI